VGDTGVIASRDDLALAERLRAGDERAFMMLVERHQAAMLRIARMYVSTRAVAEEVVQEAWLGVVNGIDRFEGRSSLRTWIFRIVMNIAKSRGAAEGRSVPFSSLAGDEQPSHGTPAAWFQDATGRDPGWWGTPPADWRGIPEDRLVGGETLREIRRAIETLPPMQAEVLRLRDVQGWSADEVCNALDLTQTNQRVLLHRARTRVRRELDEYLGAGSGGG
jgi:RNA polymerase sigma-70 factor (ECF subfamily)